MKKCARCQLTFGTWNLWFDHTKRDGCLKTIKPERTTDRSFEQIRDDAERTWLAPFIVPSSFKYPDKKQIRETVEKVLPKTKIVDDNPYSRMLKKLGKELAATKEAIHDGASDIAWGPDCDKLQARAGADEAGMP